MESRDEATERAGQSARAENGTSQRWLAPEIEDNREVCFEQGKPCIYEPEEEHGVIVTEWPNGVVDRYTVATGTRTRCWPDGTEDTQSEAAAVTFPHWPRPKG